MLKSLKFQIIILVFTFCVKSAFAETAPNDGDVVKGISVVSYNMMHFQGVAKDGPKWARWADKEWYPNIGKPGYFDFFENVLRSLDADIIAIQEGPVTTHTNWGGEDGASDERQIIPELAKRLNMNYYVQDETKWHGFSVLSKFPIAGAADYSHSGTPGSGFIRVSLEVEDGKVLHIYNTHLHYKEPHIRDIELKMYTGIMESENLRPRIFLGDLNIRSTDDPQLSILNDNGYLGYANRLDQIWIKDNSGITVEDFMAIETELTMRNAETVQTAGSDHLPVKAVINTVFEPRQPSKSSNTAQGLQYYLYQGGRFYSGTWEKIPDFTTYEIHEAGITQTLNTAYEFEDDPRNFGMVFTGYIDLPKDGLYAFSTKSFGSTRLYIDNMLVVDNDGSFHSEAVESESGHAYIASGLHPFKLELVSGGQFTFDDKTGIILYYEGPGINKQPIPESKFFHNEN